MNKIYFKPPKVKPSKNPKPLPSEWNSCINDLDKYKLSSSEIIKRKINSVSKNLDIAKKNWQENFNLMQSKSNPSGESTVQNNNNKLAKKKSLSPRHRFQNEVRSKKWRMKSNSKKFKLNKADKMENNSTNDIYSDNEEICINSNQNVIINSTKVEKTQIPFTNSVSYQIASDNKLLFEEFDETLRKMENEINKTKSSKVSNLAISKGIEKNNIKQISMYEKQSVAEEMNSPENPKNNANDYKEESSQDEDGGGGGEGFYDIQRNINNKFNNLNEIESSLKMLDTMLEMSNKSSLKLKYDRGRGEIENENESDNSFSDKPEPEIHKDEYRYPNASRNSIPIHDTHLLEETPMKLQQHYLPVESSIQIKPQKSIEINKKVKILDLDKPKARDDYSVPSKNIDIDDYQYKDMDYLKNLMEKTRSEIDNLNSQLNPSEQRPQCDCEEDTQPRKLPLVSYQYPTRKSLY